MLADHQGYLDVADQQQIPPIDIVAYLKPMLLPLPQRLPTLVMIHQY
jgi:hypothetical protein